MTESGNCNDCSLFNLWENLFVAPVALNPQMTREEPRLRISAPQTSAVIQQVAKIQHGSVYLTPLITSKARGIIFGAADWECAGNLYTN